MNANDFTVGQKVTVRADQSFRFGVVTKIGRTRITVKHPRNKAGDMVERAYPMGVIVDRQIEQDRGGVDLVYADGRTEYHDRKLDNR